MGGKTEERSANRAERIVWSAKKEKKMQSRCSTQRKRFRKRKAAQISNKTQAEVGWEVEREDHLRRTKEGGGRSGLEKSLTPKDRGNSEEFWEGLVD